MLLRYMRIYVFTRRTCGEKSAMRSLAWIVVEATSTPSSPTAHCEPAVPPDTAVVNRKPSGIRSCTRCVDSS